MAAKENLSSANIGSTYDVNCKDKPLAIAIMGPTASGKTDLSLSLAEHFSTEIISVDSALIYKGLNIGSAKPDFSERRGIVHHLIDICEPSEPYSAADFCRAAKTEIQKLKDSKQVPILVGGTMLYFKALLEGLSNIPSANLSIRADLQNQADKYGWPYLHDKLREVDPVSAARIHPNHSQRLSRALEVYYSSGKPMSFWQKGGEGGLLNAFNWLQIALAPRDRLFLHKRIEQRFDLMLDNGLIEEVERLRTNVSLNLELPSMRAVGYRQVWQYLDGELNFNEMRDKGIVATRQLAKRQLTWLRAWNDLNWVDTLNRSGKLRKNDEIVHNVLNFLPQTHL